MKNYRVYASYVVECYCDIEAESEDDAWDKAHQLDGGEFTRRQDYDGGWEIDRVEGEI